MVEMTEYFAENLQIIVNGFIWAEVTAALDWEELKEKEIEEEYDTESDFEECDVIETTDID